MDKLQYRNVAGTMKHIEGWLERALASYLPAESLERRPLKHLSLDRDSLEAYGLDKDSQDKLYRSLYLYCNGIHDFIREVSQSASELTAQLRLTFLRLFEQQFDAKQTEKFAELMAKQQDQSSLSLVEAQRAQISALQCENQTLADDLMVSRADTETARFHQDLVLLTTKEVESNLRNRIEHYKQKLAIAEGKAAQLAQSLEEYQDCLLISREIVVKLTRELHDTEKKAEVLSSSLEGLQKEHDDLSKKYKGCDIAFHKASEDLSKYREKAMTLAHANDELSGQVNHLNLERKQLKQQLGALTTQRSEQLSIHAELTQLTDLLTSSLLQAADGLSRVHKSGEDLRSYCVSTSAVKYFDEYCPSQAVAALEGLRGSMSSLATAELLASGKATATATAADAVEGIRMKQVRVREVKRCLQSVAEVMFVNTSLPSVKACISSLHHKSVHYNTLAAQLRTQQVSLSTANLLTSVYLTVADRQQGYGSALSLAIERLEGQVRQSQADAAVLAGRCDEQAARLQAAQATQAQLLELETRHHDLSEKYRGLEASKRAVEEALSAARSQVRDLQTSQAQLQAVSRAAREKDALLRDLGDHVGTLEEKLRSVSALVKNQCDSDAEHKSVLEGVQEALELLERLVQHGEDCAARGAAVFEAGAAPLTRKTAATRLRHREIQTSIHRMRSDLALRSEAFLQDEGLDRERRDVVAEIVRLLLEIAGSVVYQLRSVDELLEVRKEVANWRRECETLKAFSAKERARLTRLVVPDSGESPS